MANPRNGYFTGFNATQLAGESETINSQSITGLIANSDGHLLLCYGTAVPTDDTAGYAKGCLFIDTDVAKGTTGLYCNKGTNAECTFTAVTQA